MNSSNRRIDAPIPIGATRERIIENAIQTFHNSEPIVGSFTGYIDTKMCITNLPVLYYSQDLDSAYRCLTNVGTIHQFLSSSQEFEEFFIHDDAKGNKSEMIKKLWLRNIYNPKRLLNSESEDTEKADQPKKKAIIDKSVEVLAKLASKLKWASIEESPTHATNSPYRYNRLFEQTEVSDARPVPGLSRTSHESIYGSRVTEILNGMMFFESHDYRSLALKVDLYDDLREERFSQPSGVDYAWATKNLPETNIVSLNSLNQWHYEAIFVSLDVIEIAIQNDWKLEIGGGDFWHLRSHLVKMIPLNCYYDFKFMDVGCKVWILSHLKYPLAWVIDHYEMVLVGSKDEKRKEAFVRTAGLVNIPDTTKKIVFVITSKQNVIVDPNIELNETYTRDKRKIVDFGDGPVEVYTRDVNRSLTLTNKMYEVYGTDEHGEIPRDRKIQVHDFDEEIENLLQSCLTSSCSLREAFTRYTSGIFPSGIDWPEINSLTTILIVRWHQKVECSKKNKEAPTLAVGAPASVLKAMGLTPDPKITDESYPAYGGMTAVNSLDQRYVDRDFSQKNGFISIGEWGHFASLMVATGFAVYNTHNDEDPERAKARSRASGHDRLYRAPFLRIAFEQWKRSLGLTDRIAFPDFNSELIEKNWERLCLKNYYTHDEPKKLSTTYIFTRLLVNDTVAWFWTMNYPTKMPTISKGGTLTGIRTVSSWWRGKENTQWLPFTMKRPEGPCDDAYFYNDTPTWTKGCYEKYGDDPDYPEMERILMRLNLNATDRNWGLTYKAHHNQEEASGLSWVVDSSHGGVLANSVGWSNYLWRFPIEVLWGWGIAIWLENDQVNNFRYNQTIKTLVIPYKTAGIAIGNYFRKGTILFTEEPESEIIGLSRHFIGRVTGLPSNSIRDTREILRSLRKT